MIEACFSEKLVLILEVLIAPRVLQKLSLAEMQSRRAEGRLVHGELTLADLRAALERTRSSVMPGAAARYRKWFEDFGSA
jgi:hypothetical protein